MSQPTVMPEWLERQIENVERQIDQWPDGKREAAGIPRKTKAPNGWCDYPTKPGIYARKVISSYDVVNVLEDAVGMYFYQNDRICRVNGPGWGEFFPLPA